MHKFKRLKKNNCNIIFHSVEQESKIVQSLGCVYLIKTTEFLGMCPGNWTLVKTHITQKDTRPDGETDKNTNSTHTHTFVKQKHANTHI